jgi:hypothetical protein
MWRLIFTTAAKLWKSITDWYKRFTALSKIPANLAGVLEKDFTFGKNLL